MKKLFLYIVIFSAAAVFFSCEQPVEEEQIPYVPKLVVRAFLKEGTGIKNVYIGRTLPVSVQYSSAFADLTDAGAVIINNNIVYPLKHYGNGLYKNDTLRIVRGEKYYLLANWQDLAASAETVVPRMGTVSSIQLKTEPSADKSMFLQTDIIPYSDEVYACTWALFFLNGTISAEADSFGTVAYKKVNGLLSTKSSHIPSYYISNSSIYGVRLFIYDHEYADFYNTQGSNRVSDAIFGQTGSKIKWNIKGDGIGIFIGEADSLIKLK